MAGSTLTQKVEELTRRLQEIEAEYNTSRAVTDFRLKVIEQQIADKIKGEEELRNKVSELTAKNATLEERARHGEKATDRGWQLWLAALGFGFGLVSLLVTASLQLRK